MMDLDEDRLKISVKALESWLAHNFNTNRSSSFLQVHWPDTSHSCDYFRFSHIKAGNKTFMFLGKHGVNSCEIPGFVVGNVHPAKWAYPSPDLKMWSLYRV